jgi:acetyltransferase-like isoleucine patch superfamily enzyme
MSIGQELCDFLFHYPDRTVAWDSNAKIQDSKLNRVFPMRFKCLRENDVLEIGDGMFINGRTTVISRASVGIENSVTITWVPAMYGHDPHSRSHLGRISDQEQRFKEFQTVNVIANEGCSTVKSASTKIGDYAWLNFDVLVLKSVTISEGAIIGTGSIVTKDLATLADSYWKPGAF